MNSAKCQSGNSLGVLGVCQYLPSTEWVVFDPLTPGACLFKTEIFPQQSLFLPYIRDNPLPHSHPTFLFCQQRFVARREHSGRPNETEAELL